MQKLRTVIGLFDGMGGLQIALNDLGYKYDTYYSSEIDKHAIKQVQLNFPNTIQVGNIIIFKQAICWKKNVFDLAIKSAYISSKTKKKLKSFRDIDLAKIDLIGAGSPCQGFSFAGKQLAFNDPRSRLFFVFVEILNHVKKFNPNVKFLLENVDMKKEYLRIISENVGIFPVNINSNLLSAQNRSRNYWTNIRVKKVGLFDELYTDIPQPKDRGILLRDILDKEVDEKYYTKMDFTKRFDYTIHEGLFDNKTQCLRAADYKGTHNVIKVDKKLSLKPNQDKASCFTAGGHSGGNHSDMDMICVAMIGRNVENPSDRTKGIELEQRLEHNTTGRTNCLSTVSKDNLILTKNYIQLDGTGFDQDNRAYLEDSKSGTLDVKPNRQKVLQCDYRIRRLTPNECRKLQNIPDWYKFDCSDSQIYRMLGNGWENETIKHILSFMKI